MSGIFDFYVTRRQKAIHKCLGIKVVIPSRYSQYTLCPPTRCTASISGTRSTTNTPNTLSILGIPCNPSPPGTFSASETLWWWNQLKPVFLLGFWSIVLLLLYHGHIRVISLYFRNYKSILFLLRLFKRHIWFCQIAKTQKIYISSSSESWTYCRVK